MGNWQSSSSTLEPIPEPTHDTDYYLRLPRDIQCLQLRYITDYAQIMSLMRTYPSHIDIIKECVHEVLVDIKSEAVVWSFEEFLQWPNLEATNVFVAVTTPKQYDYLIRDIKLRQVSILLSEAMDPNNAGDEMDKMQEFLNIVYEFMIERSRNDTPLKNVNIVSEYSFIQSQQAKRLFFHNGLAFSYAAKNSGEIIVTSRDLNPTLVHAGNQIYLEFIRNILTQTKFPIQRLAFVGDFPRDTWNLALALVQMTNATDILADFEISGETMNMFLNLLQYPTVKFFGIMVTNYNLSPVSLSFLRYTMSWISFFIAVSTIIPPFFINQPIDLALGTLAIMTMAPFGKGTQLMDALHKIFPHMRKFSIPIVTPNIITHLTNNNFPVIIELPKFDPKNLGEYEEVLRMNVPITIESPPENINDRQELRRLISIYPTLLSIKRFV